MTRKIAVVAALAAMPVMTGCHSDALPVGADIASPTSDLAFASAVPGEFLFDFSGTISGGMGIGANTNVSLAFDTTAAVRHYAFAEPYKPFRNADGLFVAEELLNTCPASTVRGVDLPVGDTVAITGIAVEFLAVGDRRLPWTWCYGVRGNDGVVIWKKERLPLDYDSASDRMRGMAAMPALGATAVKIVVNTNNLVYLRSLLVTTLK